jgi:ABC-type branched-subunit amino acid transport system ATPase component
LRDLKTQGLSIILIEHNLPMVAKLCDNIAVLNNGVVELQGTPDEVVNNARVKEAFLGGH